MLVGERAHFFSSLNLGLYFCFMPYISSQTFVSLFTPSVWIKCQTSADIIFGRGCWKRFISSFSNLWEQPFPSAPHQAVISAAPASDVTQRCEAGGTHQRGAPGHAKTLGGVLSCRGRSPADPRADSSRTSPSVTNLRCVALLFQIFDNEAKDLEREVCFIDIACDEIPERYYKESEVSNRWDGVWKRFVHSFIQQMFLRPC